MVDCDAGCEASCEGSCEVDANIDCQAECQADARADCEAELQGGCDVACKSHDGALFCDGQYVDYGDNLKTCVDALKAAIHARVSGEAEAQSSCSGNSCRRLGARQGHQQLRNFDPRRGAAPDGGQR